MSCAQETPPRARAPGPMHRCFVPSPFHSSVTSTPGSDASGRSNDIGCPGKSVSPDNHFVPITFDDPVSPPPERHSGSAMGLGTAGSPEDFPVANSFAGSVSPRLDTDTGSAKDVGIQWLKDEVKDLYPLAIYPPVLDAMRDLPAVHLQGTDAFPPGRQLARIQEQCPVQHLPMQQPQVYHQAFPSHLHKSQQQLTHSRGTPTHHQIPTQQSPMHYDIPTQQSPRHYDSPTQQSPRHDHIPMQHFPRRRPRILSPSPRSPIHHPQEPSLAPPHSLMHEAHSQTQPQTDPALCLDVTQTASSFLSSPSPEAQPVILGQYKKESAGAAQRPKDLRADLAPAFQSLLLEVPSPPKSPERSPKPSPEPSPSLHAWSVIREVPSPATDGTALRSPKDSSPGDTAKQRLQRRHSANEKRPGSPQMTACQIVSDSLTPSSSSSPAAPASLSSPSPKGEARGPSTPPGLPNTSPALSRRPSGSFPPSPGNLSDPTPPSSKPALVGSLQPRGVLRKAASVRERPIHAAGPRFSVSLATSSSLPSPTPPSSTPPLVGCLKPRGVLEKASSVRERPIRAAGTGSSSSLATASSLPSPPPPLSTKPPLGESPRTRQALRRMSSIGEGAVNAASTNAPSYPKAAVPKAPATHSSSPALSIHSHPSTPDRVAGSPKSKQALKEASSIGEGPFCAASTKLCISSSLDSTLSGSPAMSISNPSILTDSQVGSPGPRGVLRKASSVGEKAIGAATSRLKKTVTFYEKVLVLELPF